MSKFFPLAGRRIVGLGLLLLLNACGGGDPGGASSSANSSAGADGGGAGKAGVDTVPPSRILAEAGGNPAPVSAGQWSELIPTTVVASSAAHLPNGKILLWASGTRFDVGTGGLTYMNTWDPLTNEITERRVDETGHDMFCTGTTNLPDGSVLINGGNDSSKTSVYNALTNKWTTSGRMNIARGYQANTPLQNGSVLTLGGSWSGALGNKHGEVWTADGVWRRLPGVPVDPALAPDFYGGIFRSDNHMWLMSAPNGKVLHAGPSPSMNWINTQGNGSITSAGMRADDDYAMNGNVAMYDIGKILKLGGAAAYDRAGSSSASYVIDVNAGVSVRKVAPMAYSRMFSNSVVLPNGQVMVIGGQTEGKSYSDDFSVLVPELWDPATERFTTLPAQAVGRNYHSVALLLPDARVLSSGSGLCGEGCAANHTDIQVYTPHYLLNDDGTPAPRPSIQSSPAKAIHGTTVRVTTDGAVGAFTLMRLGSITHTINNDQRRVPLQFKLVNDTTYDLAIPSNPGVVLPGYYMLFAMSDRGTPSVSKMIQITNDGAPQMAVIDGPTSSVGAPARLEVPVTSQSALSFVATGLPPGLSINPGTGVVSGTPTRAGQYAVSIEATNALATTSTRVLWTVEPGASTEVGYVRLQVLSDVNGTPAASMAEFNLLDGNGQVMSRTGWTVTSTNQAANGAPANALDSDPNTLWQSAPGASGPQGFVVNLGGPRVVTGFKYLPRTDSSTGVVATWRFDTSRDGVNWTPLAQGNLQDFVAVTGEKVVYFNNLARGKPAIQSSTAFDAPAARAVDGNIDGDFVRGGSVSHTAESGESWWQVDLGSVQPLTAVRLWNRTDCCDARLRNFQVLVSPTDMSGRSLKSLLDDPQVTHVWVFLDPARHSTLPVHVSGRYVRVQLQDWNALSLAEVEVFGASSNHAPVFAPISSPTSVLGRALSLPMNASDTDGDTVTFAATGLPPGLALNTVSGLVSGRPTALGTYNVTLQATDSQGASTSQDLVWTVVSAATEFTPTTSPPALTSSPVTFQTGTAAQPGASYVWNFGDGTTATVTTPDATHVYSAAGLYGVQLTVMSGGQVVGTRSFTQAVYNTPTAGRPANSSTLQWEARGTGRLWMVNPDNDSVSVFDATGQVRLAEVPTGAAPHSVAIAPDGRVWVANTEGASLSVIDPSSLQVVQTVALPRASRPQGLTFAPNGSAAYLVLEATGQLLKLDPVSGVAQVVVGVGTNPRQVSVSADSARVLVTRFITPPLPGENTAVVQTQVNGAPRGGEVMVLNASTLALDRTVVLQHSEKADGSLQGRGVPNYLGAAVISPDGLSAWVPSKQDNLLRGTLRDGQNIDFQNTVRAVSSRIDLGSLSEDLAARVDHDNAGLASAAVFHPSGAYLFVALETSRQIVVVDPARRSEVLRLDAGRAPDGLAISPDGLRLYVNNFMDRRLGVYDLSRLVNYGEASAPLVTSVAAVDADKLTPTVLLGKQLFYDARDTRLARDGYLSCAACHNDGGHDGRTWDMTGQGEGLRNTPTLRGHGKGQGLMHWSGNFDEVQDFEGQIRSLAAGTGLLSDAQFNTGTRSQPLGDKKAGLSPDLDALAAYVASLDTAEPSPYRNTDGSLTTPARDGRLVYAMQCSSCHAGTPFTDSASGKRRDIGSLKPASGKRLGGVLDGLDTPTLRGVWATAPYLHDGSAPTVESAITAHSGLALSASDLASVAAYVRQIGREEDSAQPGSGSGLTAAYFANPTLQGQPVQGRTEAVNFDWGFNAPAATVPADGFSARWSGMIEAPATGNHLLQTLSDDGVRVWIDGMLVIDNWTGHAVTTDTSVPLHWVAGQRHAITIEYQDIGGLAVAQLRWQVPGGSAFVAVPVERLYPAAAGTGLSAAYFGNATLQGAPVRIRSEAVDFQWPGAPAGVGVPPDNFSVRWSGLIEAPASGSYTLQTVSDDGIQMWIDGQMVVNNWSAHSPLVDGAGPFTWSAGQRHRVTIEYQELGGSATARLLWRLPESTEFVPIPVERLYPAATGTGLTGSYFTNLNVQGQPVLVRTEPVNFFWWDSPAPGVPADGFSVRWTGMIEAAVSGPHTLQTLSDDGVRVWVDGMLAIDNWTGHAPVTNNAAPMNWTAGERHVLTVEYQEIGGPGTAQLLWQTPDSPAFNLVPKERLYPDTGPGR